MNTGCMGKKYKARRFLACQASNSLFFYLSFSAPFSLSRAIIALFSRSGGQSVIFLKMEKKFCANLVALFLKTHRILAGRGRWRRTRPRDKGSLRCRCETSSLARRLESSRLLSWCFLGKSANLMVALRLFYSTTKNCKKKLRSVRPICYYFFASQVRSPRCFLRKNLICHEKLNCEPCCHHRRSCSWRCCRTQTSPRRPRRWRCCTRHPGKPWAGRPCGGQPTPGGSRAPLEKDFCFSLVLVFLQVHVRKNV